MTRTTAAIVFLIFQVVMAAVWLQSLAPVLTGGGEGDQAFISASAQVWSRSGEAGDAAVPFNLWGDLLYATLLLVASGVCAIAGSLLLRSGRSMLAGGGFAVAVILAGAAIWLVARQWSGATVFPVGAVNAGWLYTITRAWLLHAFVGGALLVAFTGLVMAGVSRNDRPRGFHLVAANWLVVVAAWVIAYLAVYVAPLMGPAS